MHFSTSNFRTRIVKRNFVRLRVSKTQFSKDHDSEKFRFEMLFISFIRVHRSFFHTLHQFCFIDVSTIYSNVNLSPLSLIFKRFLQQTRLRKSRDWHISRSIVCLYLLIEYSNVLFIVLFFLAAHSFSLRFHFYMVSSCSYKPCAWWPFNLRREIFENCFNGRE